MSVSIGLADLFNPIEEAVNWKSRSSLDLILADLFHSLVFLFVVSIDETEEAESSLSSFRLVFASFCSQSKLGYEMGFGTMGTKIII